MRLTEKEREIARDMRPCILPNDVCGDWELEVFTDVGPPDNRNTDRTPVSYLEQYQSYCGEQDWYSHEQVEFETPEAAQIAAARLNARGLRRTIEACRQTIREQNAKLINAYHAKGMPMDEAIHKFIEDYYEEEDSE